MMTESSYVWVGIRFELVGPVAVMSLTEEYLSSVLLALQPFMKRKGVATLAQARELVGKAARVAQVVPAATPFVASLWATLTTSEKSSRSECHEAPPGQVAVVRFFAAAGWFHALLRHAVVPLRREVHSRPPSAHIPASGRSVEFDASPWGGGAVLLETGRPAAYFATVWTMDLLERFNANTGDSRWQSLWEFVTLLLCLNIWGDLAVDSTLTLRGDNIAALQDAVALKGRGLMNAVARELTWRKALFGWQFNVEHIPSELNCVADALSRLYADETASLPASLTTVHRVDVPELGRIWHAWVDDPPPSEV